ncbi:MAG: hypothetical protein HQ594_02520, partial [Candidatus Omnitrophica bacterium]|nr:hypothetical protein [Candidatus Omnitrophota bacterium]
MNKKVIRIISLILLQTFIFYGTAFGSLDTSPPIAQSSELKALSIDTIGLPKDIGSVKSKYQGSNGKLVVHIQDAHCNYEAQGNISKILEILSKDYNINTISVEGADGYIDTSWFKAFPDAEIRKEVADYFMKKGEITGAEFLSITSDYPIKLFGAENRDLYIKNLNAFTTTYPHKGKIEKYLLGVKSILGRLKGYIYTSGIKEFDAKVEGYKDKEITLSDYAKILSPKLKRYNMDLKNYPNFSKLIYTLVYEDKIDFDVVDGERSTLIDKLSKDLPKDKLQELVLQSFSFKTGKLGPDEYYGYLRDITKTHNIDLAKDYLNLSNYVIYTKLYARIENENLFNEIENIKNAVKEKLFENDDQRNLSACWDNVNILIGLINIKLSNREFAHYKTNRDKFNPEFFTDFVKSKVSCYNLAYDVEEPSEFIKENLPKLEDFYEIATKRDRTLVDNTLKTMKSEKTDAAILITGGFHTDGITELLKKKGASYVVVCPNITKDVESPYIQVLTNQKTPFEELLVESAAPTKNDSLLAPYLRTALSVLNESAIKELDEGLAKRGETLRQEWVSEYVGVYIAQIRKIGVELDWVNLERTFWVTFFRRINELYSGTANSIKRNLLTKDMAKLIKDEFAKYNPSPKSRGSVGRESMAVGATDPERPLTPQEYRPYDELLARSFVKKRESPNAVKTILFNGLTVNIHGGEAEDLFEDMIAEENYERLFVENINQVPFSRGHPGFWKGRVPEGQSHISGFNWHHMSEEQRRRFVNHEKAHIDIYLGQGKIYSQWKEYEEAREANQETANEEEFINSLEKCDVTDIKKELAERHKERIIRNAETAIIQESFVNGLMIALMEAYMLADECNEPAALRSIIETCISDTDDRTHFRPYIERLAMMFPIWENRDYFGDEESNTREFVDTLFGDLEAANEARYLERQQKVARLVEAQEARHSIGAQSLLPKERPLALREVLEKGSPLFFVPHKAIAPWGRRFLGRVGKLIGMHVFASVEPGEECGIVARNMPETGFIDAIKNEGPMMLGQEVVNAYDNKPLLVRYIMPGNKWRVSDLSRHINDTEDRVWIVTKARSTKRKDDNDNIFTEEPRIVLGFNQVKLQAEYEGRGDLFIKAYERALSEYIDAIYKVNSFFTTEKLTRRASRAHQKALKDAGNTLAYLEKMYRPMSTRGRVRWWLKWAGIEVPEGEERLNVLRELEAKLNDFYNFVNVKEGDVIVVPKGMICALCSGVETLELQRGAGKTFFLDDGARYPVRHRIELEKRQEEPEKPSREKKEKKPREIISMNGKNARDIFNAITTDIASPKQTLNGVGLQEWHEKSFGKFTGLGVRSITLPPNHEYEDTVGDGYHILIILEGKACITTTDGVDYSLEKPPSGKQKPPVLIPASAGKYTVSAGKRGARIVKLFMPLEETLSVHISGEPSTAEDEHIITLTEQGTFTERLIIKNPEGEFALDKHPGKDKASILLETPDGAFVFDENKNLLARLEKDKPAIVNLGDAKKIFFKTETGAIIKIV